MEWVSIKDKLPPSDKSVLVFHFNCFVSMAHHIDGEFYKMWGDNKIPYSITHWMFLPPSPKK